MTWWVPGKQVQKINNIKLYLKSINFALQAVQSKTQIIFQSGLYPDWLYKGVLQLFILYIQ